MQIVRGGHTLELLPERAVLLPDRSTLIISDPHFGKAATFRAAGIPIPHGTTSDDVARLAALLQRTAATHLVILGDFFHARPGRVARTMAQLRAWRDGPAADLDVTLIRGNHDRHAGDPPAEWHFRVLSGPLIFGGLAFSHEPIALPGQFVLAGHIHPGLRLRDKIGSARVACFVERSNGIVLPAFGSFTGLQIMEPSDDETHYAVTDDAVLPVPRRLRSPRRKSSS